ncbi:MAG: 3-deoxy-7-phosphoheptulonate synthase [Candidatus Methanofastidiosum methylothiophilum]|uniref:3-deoxy-7-phosphoheptulonate synthase n=1 Tax=Candidatus Methanofastidiosum methylothiophilum TaxID=1705564 RepID=A0A150IL14_9EURY|nr:MAG: 3-deoxy-7-phosphoheptulonate synthase [Candidatus Methanofastidiosum methylthiophilus]
MIIVMKLGAEESQIQETIKRIKDLGFNTHLSQGQNRTVIGVIGDVSSIEESEVERFRATPYIQEVIRVSKPYKFVSRDFKKENTVIKIDGVEIGGKKIVVMAGPCTVESEDQIIAIAKEVKKSGATILRGGAFKPRTSPKDFQGLGEEGLKFLLKAKEETGLPIVTEVMDTRDVALVSEYADILQVGTRNMQNYALLKELGKADKPVLLKRGMWSTLKEFLSAAEYILAGGNENVMLCERGIRTFSDFTRNTLDLSIVPVLKAESHLPVIVDPSHGTGRRDIVKPMALAAIACGADGLTIEAHTNPQKAISDADQTISTSDLHGLMGEVKYISRMFGREI